MNPVVLHVVRPYSSEEEYLEAEAWTIEGRAMLLLEQAPLDLDTPVVFDVTLANGAKVIRAEARVGGHIPATADYPSALRVRFRRYSTQTKAFIERAVQVREEQMAREAAKPSSLPPPRSNVPPRRSRMPSERPGHAAAEIPAAPALPNLSVREIAEPSGVHRRPVAPVAAPPNRTELLERLRERARGLAARTREEPPSADSASGRAG